MNVGDCVRTVSERAESLSLEDPIARILAVSELSADVYGRDPALYRPLLRYLSGALEPEHHPEILARAMRLFRRPIEDAIRAGLLSRNTRVEVLERQLLVNFTGVLQFWIQETALESA